MSVFSENLMCFVFLLPPLIFTFKPYNRRVTSTVFPLKARNLNASLTKNNLSITKLKCIRTSIGTLK